MNGNPVKFEELLDKFRFREPVPGAVHEFVIANKFRTLAKILRSFGKYGFIYGLVLRTYFFLNRNGIGVSVKISKILVAVIAGILVIIVTFTGVKLYDYLYTDQVVPVEKKKASNYTGKTRPYQLKRSEHVHSTVKNRLGVMAFSGSEVDRKILNSVTGSITNRLAAVKGKNRITRLRKSEKGKNVNMILSGSIDKLGKSYIVSVKVINVENSKIIFAATENAESADDIERVCRLIAGRIANNIE